MSINQLLYQYREEIDIPSEVTVDANNYVITIKGPLGQIIKDYSPNKLFLSKNAYRIFVENSKVIVETYIKGKRGLSLCRTLASKIRNSIKGVMKGYTYKLKIIYSHFPVNIKVKDDKVFIENFIGERGPRLARIIGKDTKVKVEGEDIIINGIDKDEVSQTAANIQLATKIKKRDPRKFLDGIYIYYREK
jgi:large subunit ribosomal protein L6